jgi:hypothetical protein
VDCDDVLTTADSLDILRIVSGLIPDGECPANADFDGNGQVTMKDALLLLLALNA